MDGTVPGPDAGTGGRIATLADRLVLAAAFTPDGRVLTGPALGDDGVATVRDATTGRVAVALRSPRAAEQGAVLAAVSPDGRRAVTATFDRVAVLWDLATGQAIARLEAPPLVTGVWFSPTPAGSRRRPRSPRASGARATVSP